jgi:hypothetical protein
MYQNDSPILEVYDALRTFAEDATNVQSGNSFLELLNLFDKKYQYMSGGTEWTGAGNVLRNIVKHKISVYKSGEIFGSVVLKNSLINRIIENSNIRMDA